MSKATKPSQQKLGRVNKSEWIRRQPASIGAKDIVAKAKAEGIALSLAQVYTARSAARRTDKKPSKPGRKPRVAVTNGHTAAASDVRLEFTRLAMRLGTDEAQRLLVNILEKQA